GDVLLRYDQTRLTQRADLTTLPESNDANAKVEVEVWREEQGKEKTFTKQVRPGKLGVLVADEPAPQAIANRRKSDQLLTSRGPCGGDWPALPGTRVEAESLRPLFSAMKQPVTVLTDGDANELKLAELARDDKLAQYRYLHFATHGTYDPR